ncbi:universal stress protein (plasmid) [Haloarcula hispanica N601]|uniref:Universal stress protein n=2 Tax=Haloarcula hispanica TaxID=51589 RepID=V5TSA6_HALHI|nr:universal stress protein [Haloarcula hispanica]AHB68126.1 universal stress protein [Haloarcula hispanica N601]
MNEMTAATDTRGLETVLLAVGSRDDARVDTLVDAVTEVTVPTDATVIIAHVFDPDSYREAVEQLLETPDENIDPDELAAQMSVTQEIIDELEAESVTTVPRATTGTSGEGIVSIAKDVSADRVIVGGRQRSPAGKAIFGSTAQEVMLNAPCPVTFVRDR